MKLLVTGANGFTGVHFTQLAQHAGHTVVPLSANLTRADAVAAQVSAAVAAQPEQAWAVVHLAALSFVGHADEIAFYGVNVLGTLNLLKAIAAQASAPVRVLIASSANVYGNCEQSPIAESQVPAPINHYAASKLAMEHLARTYADRADRLSLVFARPFNYTGPGQAEQFLIPKLVSHFARRADAVELGNLQVEREYNDVGFVCQSYLHLLQWGELQGIYNICTGVTHTLQGVVARLQHLTGHAIDVQVNPAFVRANDIAHLCGNPARLQQVWQQAGAAWPQADSLDGTLTRMLAVA